MIVIRFIEDNGDLTGEQEIFCNDPCTPNIKKYLTEFELYDKNNWPIISDFLSEDYQEYCFDCEKQLNIFDEDLQRFRPRTEADNEIVKSVNFKGQTINFKRLI